MAAVPVKAWHQVSCGSLRSALERSDLKEMGVRGMILAEVLEPKQQEGPCLSPSGTGRRAGGGESWR